MAKESLFDWWSLVIMLGIVQGVIVFSILLFNNRKNLATQFLAFLVIVLIWHHLQSISIYLGFFRSFPHFYGADQGSLFLIGPLFLFYVRYQTKEKTSPLKWREWIQFTPFLITIVINPVIFQGTESKIETIKAWLTATRYDNPALKQDFILDDSIFLIESIHMIIYFSVALYYLREYSRTQKNLVSSIHQINFRWLIYITVLMLIIIVVSFILQKILYITLNYYYYSLDYIYILPMTIFIYFIAINAMLKSEIFANNLNDLPSPKYSKSSLTDELSEQYAITIREYLEVEKPFLNPEIKLGVLAADLRMQPNHLSQVINDKFNSNFFDLINTYRIEEAKLKLKDPKNIEDKMLTIALECGFNNKVSFYNYFKKITGQTPAEFRKSS